MGGVTLKFPWLLALSCPTPFELSPPQHLLLRWRELHKPTWRRTAPSFDMSQKFSTWQHFIKKWPNMGMFLKSKAPTLKSHWISHKSSPISSGFSGGLRTLHQTVRWSPTGLLCQSQGHEPQNHPTHILGSTQNPCDISLYWLVDPDNGLLYSQWPIIITNFGWLIEKPHIGLS